MEKISILFFLRRSFIEEKNTAIPQFNPRIVCGILSESYSTYFDEMFHVSRKFQNLHFFVIMSTASVHERNQNA